MLSQRYIEMMVGLFILFAFFALTVLAFKVSGLTSLFPAKSYTVTALFDDIGGLKVRAPVKIGGVQIGEVQKIDLDEASFKAKVHFRIEQVFNRIPDDSTASILTAGLLGDNYISLTPMYNNTFLKDGSEIEITRSAMVLEKLIGQFIYKMNSGSGNSSSSNDNSKQPGESHAS